MEFNRRAMLKALATVPAISLLPGGLSGCTGDPWVNILLHGLFMMEFNKNSLVIATPKFRGHEFAMRYHGQTKQDLPELVTMVGIVKEGELQRFQPENLQFPASDIGNGYLIDDGKPSKHRCTMVLPLPHSIIGLRAGEKNDFHPHAGAIGDHIKATSSNRLATITCIQYKPAPGINPFVVNYYAEHPSTAHLQDVNDALKAAQDVCGYGFTLQMDALAGSAAPYDNKFPDGVDKSDEEALYPQNKDVDVASCPQFGIHHP
jgi:hypothetical protein